MKANLAEKRQQFRQINQEPKINLFQQNYVTLAREPPYNCGIRRKRGKTFVLMTTQRISLTINLSRNTGLKSDSLLRRTDEYGFGDRDKRFDPAR